MKNNNEYFTINNNPVKIPSLLLLALFRDERFHKLDDKEGGEFYIDIFDELLANDIELNDLIDNLLKWQIKDENEFASEFASKFWRIATPYIDKIKKVVMELDKNKWINLKQIEIETLNGKETEKTKYKGVIIPAGVVKTFIIKIIANQIDWGKFIEYVANELLDRNLLDWDNLYSSTKQERLLINFINERKNLLEKDEDIILSFSPSADDTLSWWWNTDSKHIQFLNTLRKLEKNGLILVNGICVFRCRRIGFCLKANVSITNKFKKATNFEIESKKESLARSTEEIPQNTKNESKEQMIPETKNQKYKPYTEVKNGWGYFKFYKQGESIKIAKPDTRRFRLLQCLCAPEFGISKVIEEVFESIKIPKDKNDSDLLSYSPQRTTKMLTIIEYTIKELQKNKKLQGKIRYKFDERKEYLWLELEG